MFRRDWKNSGEYTRKASAPLTVPATKWGRPQAEYEMSGPFSYTRISMAGFVRRAWLAALSPAATPPTTTSRSEAMNYPIIHFLRSCLGSRRFEPAAACRASHGLTDMLHLFLHVVHQQILPERVGSGEVGFTATNFRYLLHEVHQAVIRG